MILKNTALFTLFMSLSFLVFSQQHTILELKGPENIGDVFLLDFKPNKNYDLSPDFAAMAWTNGGVPVLVRSLMKFDLSEIPEGATIIKAELSLYGYTSPWNDGHSTRDGSNDCSLFEISEDWDPSTVSWNKQPSINNDKYLHLPATVSENQDFEDIDLSSFSGNTLIFNAAILGLG